MRREPAAVEPNFPDARDYIAIPWGAQAPFRPKGCIFRSHSSRAALWRGVSSDLKDGVDKGEGFLADLAEDRGSAPPEIIPVIDHYINRVREVIALAWEEKVTRRELDASLLQVRLCYAQDLDRILQGLLLRA